MVLYIGATLLEHGTGLVSVDDIISGGEFKPFYYDGKRLYTDVSNTETELKVTSYTYPKDFDTRFGYQMVNPIFPEWLLQTNRTGNLI